MTGAVLKALDNNRSFVPGSAYVDKIHSVFSFSTFLGRQSYNIVPIDTNPAPAASIKLQPLPNHTMLTTKLTAFRAVKSKLVCTDETVYYKA